MLHNETIMLHNTKNACEKSNEKLDRASLDALFSCG